MISIRIKLEIKQIFKKVFEVIAGGRPRPLHDYSHLYWEDDGTESVS